MHRVKASLIAAGLTIWTDENLRPGTPSWYAEIQSAIENAGCIVVLVSPSARNSKWVREEISYTQKREKQIFPVHILGEDTESVMFGISMIQHVDVRRKEGQSEEEYDSLYAQEIDNLANTIKEYLGFPADVPPTAPSKSTPESDGGTTLHVDDTAEPTSPPLDESTQPPGSPAELGAGGHSILHMENAAASHTTPLRPGGDVLPPSSSSPADDSPVETEEADGSDGGSGPPPDKPSSKKGDSGSEKNNTDKLWVRILLALIGSGAFAVFLQFVLGIINTPLTVCSNVAPGETPIVEVTNNTIQAHEGVGDGSPIIAELHKGEHFEIISEVKVGNTTWYQIRLNDARLGWIVDSRAYIQVCGDPGTVTAVTLTPTDTPIPTATDTPITPTATAMPTNPPSLTATSTSTHAATNTSTVTPPTVIPTATETPTNTPTNSPTPTNTPTPIVGTRVSEGDFLTWAAENYSTIWPTCRYSEPRNGDLSSNAPYVRLTLCEAVAYCQSIGGRLPTLDELQEAWRDAGISDVTSGEWLNTDSVELLNLENVDLDTKYPVGELRNGEIALTGFFRPRDGFSNDFRFRCVAPQ